MRRVPRSEQKGILTIQSAEGDGVAWSGTPGVKECQNKAPDLNGPSREGGWHINWEFPGSKFYQKGLSRVPFMREHRGPTVKILGHRDEDEAGKASVSSWDLSFFSSRSLSVSKNLKAQENREDSFFKRQISFKKITCIFLGMFSKCTKASYFFIKPSYAYYMIMFLN